MVLIDNQNLYYPCSKEIPDRLLDYRKLKDFLVSDRSLFRIVAFVVDDGTHNSDKFFKALQKIGIELKTKNLKIFGDGKKKGDCDVDITVEAMRDAGRVDTVVLVSGDEDFVPLVRELQRLGKKVEVVSWESSISQGLWRVADKFYNLSEWKLKISILHNNVDGV